MEDVSWSTLSVAAPAKEEERLKVLLEADILDSKNEEIYERYTTMASRIFKAPIAIISLVDQERQWFKSRVGLAATETHRRHAFCAHAILDDSPPVFVVPDASQDPRFQQNPLVTGSPHIRFYAGASLEVEGMRIGTLCIIDSEPRDEVERTERLWEGAKRRKVFGEKEAAILQDLACIVANLIRTRREEKLTGLCKSLATNASILKLYRIPLQNVGECKEELKKKYQALKAEQTSSFSSLARTKTSSKKQQSKDLLKRRSWSDLIEQLKSFSKQVNRLMLISSSIITLLAEVNNVHHSLSSSDVSLPPMSRTNLPRVKAMLRDYCRVSFHSSLDSSERILFPSSKSTSSSIRPSSVRIRWMEEAVSWSLVSQRLSSSVRSSESFPKQVFSYPMLLQLQLMILYDYYDFHGVPVTISITSELLSHDQADIYEAPVKSYQRCGHWIITVEEPITPHHPQRVLDTSYLLVCPENVSSCVLVSGSSRKTAKDDDRYSSIIKIFPKRKNSYEFILPFYIKSSDPSLSNHDLCSTCDVSTSSVVGLGVSDVESINQGNRFNHFIERKKKPKNDDQNSFSEVFHHLKQSLTAFLGDSCRSAVNRVVSRSRSNRNNFSASKKKIYVE